MIRNYRVARILGLSAAFAAFSSSLAAQEKVPVRQLGAITATSSDTLGVRLAVRPLSDGRVLVNDIGRKRVLLFDASLKSPKVVIDSAGASGAGMAQSIASAQLIAYPGDSTLYVDIASLSLLVIDPSGKVARVMALPRPSDAMFLSIGAVYGTPGMDAQGRLLYRGNKVIPPKPQGPDNGSGGFRMPFPEQPDSQPIVRADFDTRKVDTLTSVKAFKPGDMSITQDKEGNMLLKIVMNPLDTGDEWAVLADGTLAVVSAHDYHIEWLDPDGKRRTTEKMPYDWKRLTDEQKQFKIDSIKPEVAKQLAAQASMMPQIPTPNGMRKLIPSIDFLPINKWPDYEPPITVGSLRPDLDNNLWIMPRTAIPGGTGGLRYDVVNRKGELFERVQLPKGRAIVGFGPGGAVYMINTDGKTAVLERASLR